jgi:porphobilinogen deaminase
MENKLSKNIVFVKCFEPYDFTRNMGQLAVQVTYTDGDTDMLTTKSTKENVNSSFEFENEQEFYQFLEFLQSKNIPRK